MNSTIQPLKTITTPVNNIIAPDFISMKHSMLNPESKILPIVGERRRSQVNKQIEMRLKNPSTERQTAIMNSVKKHIGKVFIPKEEEEETKIPLEERR